MELETSRVEPEMEELLYQLLWSHLQAFGLFREKHVVLTNLRAQAGISTKYDRWLQESIALLDRKHYLNIDYTSIARDYKKCTVVDSALIEREIVWQHWDQHKERWMQDANLRAQVVLVEAMLRALPIILTGKRPATEVMFPNGSMQLVEGIYQQNVIADSFNEVLARLLVTYLQERLTHDRHARIRILEIGAGTGGTTGRVLQMVQPYQASIAEYCYSDISKAFLRYGQQMYEAEYPLMTYRLFNVEKPLAGQGIEPGSYDVVIAANVLHATSNIRRAVRNVKAVLKKHGLLLLNEITGTSLFTHLTFGLLEGWWTYEDPELRVSGCPALAAESWQVVLSSEGFGAIHIPTRDMQEAGQQVIVAESDGVVRQPPVGQAQSKNEALDLRAEASAEIVPVLPSTLSVPSASSGASLGSAQGTILTTDNTDEMLRETSIAHLKELVGKVLHLPSTKINATEPLANYGLNSIHVLQLTNTLRTDMEQISSTLFFEYATIDALVEHFLHTQKEALAHLVGVNAPAHGLAQASPLPLAPVEDMYALDHDRLAQLKAPVSLPVIASMPRRFLTEEQTGGTGNAEEDIEIEGTRAVLSRGGDVAIIGLTGRYPEAKDVQAFWHLLRVGKSGIREIPPERWDWRRYFRAEKGAADRASTPVQATTMYTKWGGFLEDIESFDAPFFHISPREAERMDPQERMFLEVSYACIEDAGYTPALLGEHGPVGVFVGVMNGNYPTGTAYWSIANRVSFTLGLQGPSVAVDTACSSSLTALHFAVESLMSGTSACAIVGGVNLIVDPVHYVRLSQLEMLSASDQCKSFGQNADGFVDGEGVGAILLKPLQRAEADRDHIYGVIKATAINHGGKTNGYTVPNPQAQAKVIQQALQRAGIDPRTISYIEAHGTGTELGDPIEIAGLTRAFEACGTDPDATDKVAPRWCAIGSVKSNIGHAESAAGIAGITKVLLQMRYGQLVPSLHAQVLNPHIDFSATPFVVQQELVAWKRPQVPGAGEGKRRAGISSFGAGGSNAHVILEEYVERQQSSHWAGPDGRREARPLYPALIVLSARTEERLHEQVQHLLAWVQEAVGPVSYARTAKEPLEQTQRLHNLAYTLQVGREVMRERLVLQVSSLTELEEKLHRFLQEPQEAGGWYRGQVRQHDAVGVFAADEDGQKAVSAWMSKGKYGKLLELWVKGFTIDWKHLYTVGAGLAPALPRRISLPTYPFARERYWIPIATTKLATSDTATIAFPPCSTRHTGHNIALHPLVQHNTSTLWEQRFSSTFHGDEFFLADHMIKGEHVMPRMVYLEMARAAVIQAIGADASNEPSSLRLSHVVWTRPLIVSSHPVMVHIVLEAQESGTISFLVSEDGQAQSTIPTEEETEAQIYCQGTAFVGQAHEPQSTIPSMDLPALQARCQHQRDKSTSYATECYQHYRSLGISYGPSLQGLEQLSVGEDEVLARFHLPAVVAQTCTEGDSRDGAGPHPLPYVLHPSVLEVAIQACIGLQIAQNVQEELQVPFALEELSIVGEVPAQGWAWVCRRQRSTSGSVFDIEVCDDAGRVAVRLHGLSTHVLTTEEEMRTVLLTPSWKEDAIARQEQAPRPSQEGSTPAQQVVLLCDLPRIDASHIQAQIALGGRCRSLPSSQPRRELRFQDRVVQLIQELEHLLRSQPAGRLLVQVVVAHKEEPALLEALSGVLKTAQQEYPKLAGQLIEVEGETEEEKLLAWLRENQHRPYDPRIRYRDGKRWVTRWQEQTQLTLPVNVPWKEGGCYLISGGAGGLARLFVQEIAQQVQGATVILVGRSALSREQQAQLERTSNRNIHIDYQQGDVSDGPTVHALIQRLLEQYRHLDGIIHAAGVLRDSLLLNKTQEEVQTVLAPKVIGVELLDEASSKIPLDFFILCSSLAAVVGNVGQADYASANAYLDAFAHARQALVQVGQRQGATLSINWPLWEEGGMQFEAGARWMMRERLGLEAIKTETGMKALYQALACGQAQVMMAHGQIERIKQRLLHRSPEPPVGTAPVESGTNPSASGQGQATVPTDKLREVLKHMVSDLLRVRVAEIDAGTPLSEYGFDSITLTQFAHRLNQTYQLDLTPALFFEHSTLERLVKYLHATYANLLAPHFADASPVTPAFAPGVVLAAETATAVPVPKRHSRVARSLVHVSEQKAPAGALPIAIIGMSGAFPQALDVQSLWNNLLEGRDCIGEIPGERWDWQTYFGNPATEANKTNVKRAGVMENVEMFDPQFFGISPREAEQMDPQQRLLMMYVWKAIEDAGYSAESLSGTNTALFVGTASSGYGERLSRAGVAIEGYSSTSQASVGPNRMSYFLNLHGPSEPVETACSSSLVAIHRGVNAIESGQCAMAIVGGVNTLISPEAHISISKAGMLCEDGCCKTFSAEANGFVRGEGVGMLVLKKLVLAEQAGDHIYGVVRASAENHGGRASSLTAPNPRAQANLLIAAYRKAAIDPSTVGYIEAHGTGTKLGDPIEINGIQTAFSELVQTLGKESMRTATCGIGSVKSNIGHLELAAGVAGVIKVLLQMQHKKLVKSLHCAQLNPYIQLEGSPFYIVQENQEWEALQDHAGNVLPRRAGVSSFGFGGTNAHVVLEEYVPKPQAPRSASLVGQSGQAPGRGLAPPLLIVLSARNEERLSEQVQQLLAWVQEGKCLEESSRGLQDLAYTLQVGREAMEERLALQVSSLVELEEKLCRYLQESQETGDWYRGRVRRQDAIGFFSADEDGQKAIIAWMSKGKYSKLLELWVKGGTIDWKYLYGEHLPCRISLPTYPFARERYWIPTQTFGTVPCACPPATSSTAAITFPSPIGCVHPQSSGVSPVPVAQREAEGRSLPPTIKTNGNEETSNPVGQAHRLHRVALQRLVDSPVLSSSPKEADPSQSSIGVIGANPAEEPRTQAMALGLEEELTSSLAKALYMKQSDIDVETPFVELGLDSVSSVEWIHSINKQYASNLTASSVYDYSTIRRLAGFLEKDLLQPTSHSRRN